MAKQKFNIVVGGKFLRTAMLEPCRVCGGHPPITKKPAEEECLGHTGLRGCIRLFDEEEKS